MATFDAPLNREAFSNMESRRKTVYAVLAIDPYRQMVAGDRLEFGSYGSIEVGTVRHYDSLEELVRVEGFGALIPDAESAEEAVSIVRGAAEWDERTEREHGVLALRVREAKRK